MLPLEDEESTDDIPQGNKYHIPPRFHSIPSTCILVVADLVGYTCSNATCDHVFAHITDREVILTEVLVFT